MLTIHQPLGFTFQGQRENNEDAVHPLAGEATPQNRFFIVCDGVGGAQKGELASHIAVTGFADYFAKYPTVAFSEDALKAAFAYVLEEFDAMLEAQYLLRGMATTLTLVGIGEKDVTVAHIGDSRIYQIRDGSIVFKSEDHSKVNYLLRTGLITPQQAQNHPERNVITRAIQGSHKATEIEINHLTEVKSGDYFFQCTDGVLENLTDEALCQILDSDQTNEKKLQLILNLCEGNTRDNYSGYLVQIAEIDDLPMAKEWVEPIQVMASNEVETTVELPVVAENVHPANAPQPAKIGQGFWYLGTLLVVAIVAGSMYWQSKKTPNTKSIPPQKLHAISAKDTVTKPSPTNLPNRNTLITTRPAGFSALPKSKKKQPNPTELSPASVPSVITPNATAFGKKNDTIEKKIPGG